MRDLIIFTVGVSTDKVGSECQIDVEFDRQKWDGMTAIEKADAMQATVNESGIIDIWWKEA